MKYRVGVDCGGTFTDLVSMDEKGRVSVAKSSSTPQDPSVAVENVIKKSGIDLRDVTFFSHGATVGANTVIQNKGVKTAIVTTKGFRDILELRRGQRVLDRPTDMYNLQMDLPQDYVGGYSPLVERPYRFEIPERLDHRGKKMPEYLKQDVVVGLGEIGLDAGIDSEVRLFRTHLQIAKEHDMPIIVHTPTPHEPQAETVLEQIINIIKEEGFPIERAVLDHTGLNTLQTRLDSGAMVGLSICYDKLSPEDAAKVVLENPDNRDQLLVNSEFGWGGEGYFSVPRSVLAMRRMGLKRDVIEHVTWENPKKFFNLDID